MGYLLLLAAIFLIYWLSKDNNSENSNVEHRNEPGLPANPIRHEATRTSQPQFRNSTICHIAGAPYYIGGKLSTHMRIFRSNQILSAVREPNNQYDAKAIALYLGGMKVGHVPKEINEKHAAHMDRGGNINVEVLKVEYDDPWRGVTIEIKEF